MKKVIYILLSFLFILVSAGCSRTESSPEEGLKEGVYSIYSVNGSTLTGVSYESATTDSDRLVEELLKQMELLYDGGSGNDKICVETQSINNQVVYLSFNQAYFDMDTVQEVLFRAAVVKTIAQVPGISYVYFYVNGSPLTYENGSVVGKMAASDFVDETDDDLDALAWTTLTLYFANSTGDRLKKESIPTAYSKTMSVERLVIEQLIAGPEDSSLKATLPSSLKVLGISVKDGICYLNLDGTFLNEIVDVPAAIQIYSIVNSLCELPNISEVQIQVNGGSNNSLREISLENTFTRNIDLIETEEAGTD